MPAGRRAVGRLASGGPEQEQAVRARNDGGDQHHRVAARCPGRAVDDERVRGDPAAVARPVGRHRSALASRPATGGYQGHRRRQRAGGPPRGRPEAARRGRGRGGDRPAAGRRCGVDCPLVPLVDGQSGPRGPGGGSDRQRVAARTGYQRGCPSAGAPRVRAHDPRRLERLCLEGLLRHRGVGAPAGRGRSGRAALAGALRGRHHLGRRSPEPPGVAGGVRARRGCRRGCCLGRPVGCHAVHHVRHGRHVLRCVARAGRRAVAGPAWRSDGHLDRPATR